MKKTILLLLTSALLMGCGSAKPQIEVVPQASHDTVYLSNVKYDSIYISKEIIYEPLDSSTALLPPFKGGPGRVSDRTVEYRYHLLRDTINIHEVDSIPVIQEVEVVHTERYIPWFVRALAWIGALTLLLLFIRLLSNH